MRAGTRSPGRRHAPHDGEFPTEDDHLWTDTPNDSDYANIAALSRE